MRSLFLVPLAVTLLYACSDEHEPTPEGYADVLLVGTVTDEALIALAGALDQGPPADMPTKAPTLTTPMAGALPKSPPPVFSWTVGASASLPPGALPAESPMASAELWSPPSPAPQTALRRFIGPLRDLFGPVRKAYAHGTPFTGTATLLVFSTDADPKLLRALTSEATYTPDQASWDKIVAAGKPFTLTLTSAEFETNRILQGGGPYKGSSVELTIAP